MHLQTRSISMSIIKKLSFCSKLTAFGLLFSLLLLNAHTLFAQDSSIENAKALFDNGELEAAKKQFKSVLESQKEHPEATYYLGRIEFEEEDYSDATKWFEKAVKYKPQSSTYTLWLGRAFGRRAQSASKLRQPFLAKKTKSFFEKAIELDANNIDARSDLISYYLQAPGFLGGSVTKAKEQADEIKKRDPIEGHLAWADIYKDQKQPLKQQEEYYGLISDFPDNPTGYYQLISFFIQQERAEEAIPIAQKVIEVDTSSTRSLLTHGNVMLTTKNYKEALDTYTKVIERDQSQALAYYQIGRISAESGMEPENGIQHLERYLSWKPSPNDNSLAWAHYRIGQIYQHMDRVQDAREEYKIALSKNKKHEGAKKALKALK